MSPRPLQAVRGARTAALIGLVVVLVGTALVPVSLAGSSGRSPTGGPVSLTPFASLLSAGAITPANPGIDDGQSIPLTANPSGGSGAYTIQWYEGTGSGNCGGGTPVGTNSTSYTTAALSASGSPYYYCYGVTDSLAATDNSSWDQVDVHSALSAPGTPSVSATVLDADQPLTVSGAIPTSGSPPYSWTWLASLNGGAFAASTVCTANGGTQASAGAAESCSIPGNSLTGGATYSFELRVSDNGAPAETATSTNSSLVRVHAALSPGAVSPISPKIDNGQTITLTANPSGGTTPYAYQWYSGSSAGACTALGSPISGATGATEPVAPSSTTYYCYTVSDALSDSGTSSADALTVSAALTAPSAPTVSATSLDADQPVTVSGNLPTTGASPYAWQWEASVNGGAFASTTECATNQGTGASAGAKESCVISANTLTAGDTYGFELKVTDSAYSPMSAISDPSPTVGVDAALSSGAVTPSSPAIDTGQSVTLSAHPAGGTPPYHLQWYSASGDSGACNAGTKLGTTTTETVSPTKATYYCYVATDSSGSPESRSSAWDEVAVNGALTAGAATPGSPDIDSGQTITLSAHPSGGTPSYSYRWHWAKSSSGACAAATGLGSGASQSTGSEITGPGTYYYCYVVTDSSSADSGHVSVASAWDQVKVNSALAAPATPVVSATTLDVDQSLSVAGVIPSSGTPTYSWRWLVSTNGGNFAYAAACEQTTGSGATGGQSVTCTIVPNTLPAGHTYAYELQVTDNAASPETVKSSPSSTVTIDTALTPPVAPVPSATSLDPDQSLSVAGTIPTTGTPTYTWQWWVSENGGAYAVATVCGASGGGGGASGGSSETCAIAGGTLNASTSYSFELEVTDSASAPESATSPPSAAVTTSSVLSAGTPTASSVALDTGQSVNLTTHPSGGTAPYSYQWYAGATSTGCTGLSSPIPGATSATYALTPIASAYYCYVATDAQADTAASAAILIRVAPALAAPSAPIPSASALDTDQSLEVSATIPSTGTPSYAWQWLLSTDGGALANSTVCATDNGTGAAAGASVSCVVASGRLSPGASYLFALEVTDNASTSESATSANSSDVAVSAPLSAPAAPTPSSVSINVTDGLSVSGVIPSTGVPGYAWAWSISVNGSAFVNALACAVNSGTGAAAGATIICAIAPGALLADSTYAFELSVTDSATSPETRVSLPSATVTVFAVFVAGAPGPTSPTIDLGQSVTLHAGAFGGSGSYSYQWYLGATAAGCTGLGSPIAGATAASYTASPVVSTYYCYVVTDPLPASPEGTSIVSTADLVTVHAALVAPPAPAPSNSNPGADQSFSVTATIPSSGSPPYSWLWLVSVDGGPFVNASACGVSETGSGAGGGATESCEIPAQTLIAGHTYVFEFKVTDNATNPVTTTSAATAPITVLPSSTAPPAGSSSSGLYAVLAVVLVAVAALVGVLFARRRRVRPGERRARSARPPPSGPSPPVTAPLDRTTEFALPAEPEVPAAAVPPTHSAFGPEHRSPWAPASPAPAPSVPSPPSSTSASTEAAVLEAPAQPWREEPTDVDGVLAELDQIARDLVKRAPSATDERKTAESESPPKESG